MQVEFEKHYRSQQISAELCHIIVGTLVLSHGKQKKGGRKRRPGSNVQHKLSQKRDMIISSKYKSYIIYG